MSLQLFGHPFSSYTWKVLIALWADGTPFSSEAVVFDALRPAGHRNPADRSIARERFRTQPTTGLRKNSEPEPWTIGEQFTLADCAAAPSLFYADWVEEIDDRVSTAERLSCPITRPPGAVARAVDEARAYRPLFPLSALPTATEVENRRSFNRSRSPNTGQIKPILAVPVA